MSIIVFNGMNFHMQNKVTGSKITGKSVQMELETKKGRKLFLSIVADDGIDKISEGTHQRFFIDAAKLNAKLAAKINAE